jgi:DNA-binding response OmpR family regulator
MASKTTRRVLVLEDKGQLATQIADLLEAAGYDVAGPVHTVIEAKRIVGLDGVDCAVVDADLTYENPLRLAKEIACQGAPVLLLSDPARKEVDNRREQYRQLAKPFTGQQLLNHVDALFT